MQMVVDEAMELIIGNAIPVLKQSLRMTYEQQRLCMRQQKDCMTLQAWFFQPPVAPPLRLEASLSTVGSQLTVNS